MCLPVYHRWEALPPEEFCGPAGGEDPYTHPATGARLANLVYKIRKVEGEGDARRKLQGLVDGCGELPGQLMVLEATDRFAFVASLQTPHLVSWTIARGTQTPLDVGIDVLYLLTGRTHANPHAKGLLDFHDKMCTATQHTPSTHGYTIAPDLTWTGLRKPTLAPTFTSAIEQCNTHPDCIGFQQAPAGGYELVTSSASYGPSDGIASYVKPRGFVRMAAGHSKGGAEVIELGKSRQDVTVHAFNPGGVNNLRGLFRSSWNVNVHKICGDAVSALILPLGRETYYAQLPRTPNPHSSRNFLPTDTHTVAHPTDTPTQVSTQHDRLLVTRTTWHLATTVTIGFDTLYAPSPYILTGLGVAVAGYRGGARTALCSGVLEGLRSAVGHPVFALAAAVYTGEYRDMRVAALKVFVEFAVSRVQRVASGPRLAVAVIFLHVLGQFVQYVLENGWRDIPGYTQSVLLPSLRRMTASYIGGSIGATLGHTLGTLIPLPVVYSLTPSHPYARSTAHWASSLLFSVAGRVLGAAHAPDWAAYPYLALAVLSLA